tara:strand:- start:94707 stop:95696 length:990 start_codon:yes stop_codon:yes gene_type:complete
MSKNFHLLIPGLLPATQFKFEQSFQNLSQLLSKAQIKPQENLSLESQMIKFFGLVQSTLPAGALCALYYDVIERTQTDQNFCQVDPVQTRLDAHTAFLIQTLYSHLDSHETSKLKSALDILFDPTNQLNCQEDSWFCALTKMEDLSANPIWDVLGKSLHCRLPSGPDAATYQRLMTECEMLLSAQSFGTQDDQCHVDSLWFWGFGTLPEIINTDFDLVLSNEVSIKGLAKCANIGYAGLPKVPTLDLLGDNILLVDTTLLKLQTQGAITDWMDKIQDYDLGWMSLLLEGLRSGEVSSVNLDLGQDIHYKITKNNLHYFWRKVKSVESFI